MLIIKKMLRPDPEHCRRPEHSSPELSRWAYEHGRTGRKRADTNDTNVNNEEQMSPLRNKSEE